MREDQSVTPQPRKNWRGRLLFGLAGLALLVLLPLGLLFGYGAWLNARPMPSLNLPEPANYVPSIPPSSPEREESASTESQAIKPVQFIETLRAFAATSETALVQRAIHDCQLLRSIYFPTVAVLSTDPAWLQMVRCLDEHRAWLDELDALALRKRDEFPSIAMPNEAMRLMGTLPELLFSRYLLHLERGESSQAFQGLQRLYAQKAHRARSEGLYRGDYSSFLWRGNMALRLWLESYPLSPIERQQLTATLNQLSFIFLDPGALHQMLVARFRSMADGFGLFAQSWNTPFYGFDDELYRKGDGWDELGHTGFYVPGPHRRIMSSIRAIYRKNQAQEFLIHYNAYMKTMLDQSGWDYPAWQAGKLRKLPPLPAIMMEYGWSNERLDCTRDVIDYFWFQARDNLNRAALAWLEDPHSRPADGAVDFHKTPTHPWRDPFTEQPFHVDQTATATLIYSLGPDLADQHGQLAYDPTNGAASAGDIVIHIGGNYAK